MRGDADATDVGPDGTPREWQGPASVREELKQAVPIALAVIGTLMPATVVIPVLRPFVAQGWPGAEWVFHAFMAVNLLGACLGGPALALLADRSGRRRLFAGGLALLDAVAIGLVALKPPLAVMLGLRLVQGAAGVGAVSVLMGAARGRAKSSAAMGMVGSSVVLALVLWIPLGAILGRGDPTLPLVVGAVVGGLAGVLALVVVPTSRASTLSGREVWSAKGVRLPVLVVGLERFTVGTITVTLQLYAHHVLGAPDGLVSRWFSVFLVTFALATIPLTRLGDRIDRSRLVALGAVAYGGMFLLLPVVSRPMAPLLLAFGGLASAAIYGPSLSLVGQSVGPEARASAMGLLNAAGTFGMFLGNVTAGLLSAGLLETGASRASAYTAVFVIAAASQLVSAVLVWRRRGSA